MIRPVDLSPGKGPLQPLEDRFMPDMHPQRSLRLGTVSAEVPFADQQPGKKAEVTVVRRRAFPVVHVTAPQIAQIEAGLPVRLRAAPDSLQGHGHGGHLVEACSVLPARPPPGAFEALASLTARSSLLSPDGAAPSRAPPGFHPKVPPGT